jgi:hypothetical protein
MMLRLVIVFLLLATSVSLAQDRKATPLEQEERALAERMCSASHAVGRRGKSPHVGAPAFRTLGRRVELDTFTDRLREGLRSEHPDMPTFRFTREDARALLALSQVDSGAIVMLNRSDIPGRLESAQSVANLRKHLRPLVVALPAAGLFIGVCTENSDSHVVVMQSAEERL